VARGTKETNNWKDGAAPEKGTRGGRGGEENMVQAHAMPVGARGNVVGHRRKEPSTPDGKKKSRRNASQSAPISGMA